MRSGRALAAILVSLPVATALALPAGALAQSATVAAAVVQGPCPASGPELAPLTAPAATAPGAVASSTSMIPLSIADLLGGPSAIALLDATQALLACGDVAGSPDPNGELAVAVPAVAGSVTSGVAFLSDHGDGSTTVRLAVLAGGGTGPETSPAPSGAPVTSVALDSTAWFGGFSIAFTEAVIDPSSGELVITGTYTNEGTGEQSLLAIQVNSAVRVDWNGQTLQGRFGTAPNVAGGATVQEEIRVAVPEGFSITDATLTLGKADEHQAIVPLAAGATPTFEAPIDVPVDARAVIKGLITVKATSAEVVPATCGGTPSAMYLMPAPADQQSLVVHVRESAGPNAVVVGSFATGPGGISAPGTPGGTSLMGPRDTTVDGRYCYTLPAPISGKVKVTVQAFPGGVGEKQKSFTIDVP